MSKKKQVSRIPFPCHNSTYLLNTIHTVYFENIPTFYGQLLLEQGRVKT